MGRALYDGWIGSGWLPGKIAVADVTPSRCIGALDRCQSAGTMLVLAVKPQHVATVLLEHDHRLRAGDCVLSIAAGIELATLRRLVQADRNVFRAMPNLPVCIGSGAIGLCHQQNAKAKEIDAVKDVLSRLGLCAVLEETHFDSFTALVGSGPAYFYAFVEHLTKAGQAVGLPPAISDVMAAQVFIGAAKLLDRLEMSPAELRNRITSPAGTTAAGLEIFNRDDALASLVNGCVAAAGQRSRELSETTEEKREL